MTPCRAITRGAWRPGETDLMGTGRNSHGRVFSPVKNFSPVTDPQ